MLLRPATGATQRPNLLRGGSIWLSASATPYGAVFDRLWAIVAYESIDTAHISSQRLLWSPEHQAWRRAYSYGATGFSPEPTNAQPDAE